MDKRTGLWAFFLLAILLIVMGWATWNEHVHGSEHTFAVFYNSMWFTLLWILLATVACYVIVAVSLHRRLSVFLLHAAFLLILSGALVTRLTGRTGQIHLRESHQISHFFDEATHRKITFPFSLILKSFRIEYYPGTTSPANYVSIVDVKDNHTGERFEREISMNNILRYKGYRFYQSSFDEDWKGSILSVNRDLWGISLSYAGYFLMFFSMLYILFDRRERFRFLLRKLAQKTAVITLLLFFPSLANATPALPTSDSQTLNDSQAESLGRLWVDYQGRITPVQTLANDFTKKLTGKTHYKDISGEQVFFGWLLFPEKWQYEPMFELKSDELKHMANSTGKASLADFIDEQGHNKLERYRHRMYGSNKPEGWLKEAVKLDDKFHLIEMLQSGSLLKIFPLHADNGNLQWYSPNMKLPQQADSMENVFARHFFPLYFEALTQGNSKNADLFVSKLSSFQIKKAGDVLPSTARMKMERLYNRVNIFSLLFKICLGIGCIGLLVFIFSTIRNRTWPRVERIFLGILWLAFLLATAGLVLRGYIGGRIPMSNGYETLLLLAWFSLLTGILARRYSFLIITFSFLLSGFALLVAHISSMNPQITPLVPVLQSPLLSIHVLTIMIAYGLCGFMALNSISSIAMWLFGKQTDKTAYIQRMKETSELFMFPATFLLGSGIFIGAIWANVSWGRYWGWDPKEIWALITFLLMGFTFHSKTLKWFRNPLFYHVFVLLIFLAVLMTYFGVNYILGGKHSYAG